MTNAEIQVGEYVRTKSGNIGKVLDITNITMQKRKKYLIKWDISTAYYITLNIVNHSSNIIDLIEVGDYVNGDKVDMLTEIGGEKVLVCNDYNLDDSAIIYNNKRIKTIVTKEQMEAVQYVI